jgi:hypothetical protein
MKESVEDGVGSQEELWTVGRHGGQCHHQELHIVAEEADEVLSECNECVDLIELVWMVTESVSVETSHIRVERVVDQEVASDIAPLAELGSHLEQQLVASLVRVNLESNQTVQRFD